MATSQNKNLMDLTIRTKDFVMSRGASLVGVAVPERLSKAPKGHRPQDFLPNTETVISIGLRMNRTSIICLPATITEYKADYDIANMKLNTFAWDTVRFLEDLGYEALRIPASSPFDKKRNFGDISHKHAAVASGQGRFGLNNLVLTPNYGPYVRFVTVLTNARLKPDEPLTEDICLGEKCVKCIKACPVGALKNWHYDGSQGWQINKAKCQEYLEILSEGSVCGLCIKACPIGKHSPSQKTEVSR
jgi:epoxyqueuosine reductase QueG